MSTDAKLPTEEKNDGAELLPGSGTWTVEEEKAVLWKLDKCIIPFVCLLYLCNYLDRGNLSNAKVANTDVQDSGMLHDLHMSQLDYNFALGIFFIGYALGEIPSNFFMKAWGARLWFTRIMFTWGIMATCMGAVQNYAGLLVVRLLFGFAEAGFFPGMAFFFILFYRPYERSRRLSWLFTMSSLASAFSGLFATAISGLDKVGGLSGWRQERPRTFLWIFILEGIPSILMAFATFFYMPDYPSKAWFLDEREKFIAINRLPKEDVKEEHKAFVLSEYLQMFKDWKVWILSLVYLIWVNNNYAKCAYLPTVVKNLGYKSSQAQLMTVPIYMVQLVAVPIFGYIADHTKKNWAVIVVCQAIAMTGFLVNAISTNDQVKYAFLFFNNVGIASQLSPIVAWIGQIYLGSGSTQTAGALGFISGFGHFSGISGPNVFQADDSPRYTRAWSILTVTYAFGMFLILFMQYRYGANKAIKEDDSYHNSHDNIHEKREETA
ncbi:MFS general substrate transporter [Gonapodya prolifera JEL478]|uniref:MFS general substrate transporter n=1 Tax=Gonapodya prolifera (strain JEL478) TaxID=1344416 RepID=A0A139ATL9_GONPJ|nr:MFS general substrate transporter [Gonapodya prolifera JEL478]|eukprot:KXS20071.1 MFS general substrate transporter [Gonapodya prolifera JEL478]